MAFPNDGTCVIKMEYSEKKISAVLGMETVAAYRLKELQHFQAIEQLVTWRRTHGYDRDDSWMQSTRPVSPQGFTASSWFDLQELKNAISVSGRARP